jgi:beta-lactam-binding protein with PASTA domain
LVGDKFVSFASKGLSAIGRLAAIVLLAAAFLFGLAGVVYMSLQGSEVQVPEITGKDLNEGERELAQLGLKMKKRADRASAEAPNTVIEQLPKPGETVKTGQMILVVTSRGPGEGVDKSPAKVEEDDSEKIEEMLDDKPKKSKSNSNSNRKKADTTRDVSGNVGGAGSNSGSGESNSNKSASNNNSTEKPNHNTQPVSPRLPNPGARPSDTKPKPHR